MGWHWSKMQGAAPRLGAMAHVCSLPSASGLATAPPACFLPHAGHSTSLQNASAPTLWPNVWPKVLSAEVGREELVSGRDPRTGRTSLRYETVWRRAELAGHLGWRARHAPEDPSMQLYAAYKYPR